MTFPPTAISVGLRVAPSRIHPQAIAFQREVEKGCERAQKAAQAATTVVVRIAPSNA